MHREQHIIVIISYSHHRHAIFLSFPWFPWFPWFSQNHGISISALSALFSALSALFSALSAFFAKPRKNRNRQFYGNSKISLNFILFLAF